MQPSHYYFLLIEDPFDNNIYLTYCRPGTKTLQVDFFRRNEINDIIKFIESKPCISICCAKITFNTIKYLLEGHNQSYFTIRNQCIQQTACSSLYFPAKI